MIFSTVISLCIPYLVADLASSAGKFDWAASKTKAHAAVAGAFHSTMADELLDRAIDGVLDACAKVCQDKPGLEATLTALAKHDQGAAVAAFKTMAAKVAPAEIVPFLLDA